MSSFPRTKIKTGTNDLHSCEFLPELKLQMSRLLIKEETKLTFKTISPHHHLPQTVGGGECDVRQPIVNEGLGFHAVFLQRLSLDQIPKWRIKEWPKCKNAGLHGWFVHH